MPPPAAAVRPRLLRPAAGTALEEVSPGPIEVSGVAIPSNPPIRMGHRCHAHASRCGATSAISRVDSCAFPGRGTYVY